MEKIVKQVFFGFEIAAPWPNFLENGRLLSEKDRHCTFLFLGKIEKEKLLKLQPPAPPFLIAPVGKFDDCLFLPKKHPHIVAWHMEFFTSKELLEKYREDLSAWTKIQNFPLDEREMLPHITIAREPENTALWKENFRELPFFCKAFHLYESLGNSQYKPLWSHFFLSPFEEVEHTADIAFLIRGKTFDELFLHAQVALSFTYPEILFFLLPSEKLESLDAVIIALNELVSRMDQEIGCPFKAVSFHGEIEKRDNLLTWEMIVDV